MGGAWIQLRSTLNHSWPSAGSSELVWPVDDAESESASALVARLKALTIDGVDWGSVCRTLRIPNSRLSDIGMFTPNYCKTGVTHTSDQTSHSPNQGGRLTSPNSTSNSLGNSKWWRLW